MFFRLNIYRYLISGFEKNSTSFERTFFKTLKFAFFRLTLTFASDLDLRLDWLIGERVVRVPKHMNRRCFCKNSFINTRDISIYQNPWNLSSVAMETGITANAQGCRGGIRLILNQHILKIRKQEKNCCYSRCHALPQKPGFASRLSGSLMPVTIQDWMRRQVI